MTIFNLCLHFDHITKRVLSMEIIGRINELIIALQLSSRAFAIACDIKYTTLNNYMTGRRAVGLDTIQAILLGFPNVSAEWLMRGEGPMFKSTITTQNDDRVLLLTSTIGEMQNIIEEKQALIDALIAENDKLKKQQA